MLNESDHPSDPRSIPPFPESSSATFSPRTQKALPQPWQRGAMSRIHRFDPPFTEDDETALNGNLGWNGMV